MFGSTFTVDMAEPSSPPMLELAAVELVEPGWASVIWDGKEVVDAPSDFAIWEVRDNALDDQAMVAFMNKWGLLHGTGAASVGHLPPTFLRAHGSIPMVEAQEKALASGLLSLDVTRIHLQVLRALGDVYLGRAEGDESLVANAWEAHGFRPTKGEHGWQASEQVAASVINAALAGFHIRVAFGETALPPLATTTYSTAVLLLVQAMTPGRVVLRCENVKCGRPFTRQRGRSRYPEQQHMHGVKYCSHHCAKAQLERNRRARQKALAESAVVSDGRKS